MTIENLITSGLIKDEDTVAVHMTMIGNLKKVRRGKWYNDQILDVMDREIDTLHYIANDWDITLQAAEDEE